jgi:NAD(P)-dependent dehydrogenase (short-subunit alcohol dehydrogenase family)
MNAKVILVTGGTDGIGKATAASLAGQGHHIIITGRNSEKAAKVAAEIRQQANNPNVEYLTADFASLDAVRALALAFLGRHNRLDVLINNAGLVSSAREVSRDGYELQLAVNHLAPFLLTNLLLDALKRSPSARIVNISSVGHARGAIWFDDLQFEREFLPRQAYYQTKLANVLFTYALARRLKDSRVTANVLHPGIVKTTLSHNYMGNPIFRFFEGMISVTPEKGSQTTIHVATSPALEGVTGKYFVRKQDTPSAPHTYDEALQDRLWAVSEELVGLNVKTHSA